MERQISDSASPIRNEKGEIVGVVLIFRDVTEEYEWQQKIADSEANLKSIYDNMSQGLCYHELVYDEYGKPVNYRILGVNPSYERILSVSSEAVLGKLATEAYQLEKPPFFDTYLQVVESGEPTTFEVDFAPMGKQFSISVFCPGPGKFATVFSDITERKDREQRMQEINSILRTVRSVNQLITREKSRTELIKKAATIMVDNREFHHCWISLNEQPSHKPILVLNPPNPTLEERLKHTINEGSLHCIESYNKDLGVNLIKRPPIECNACPMSGRYENQHGICSALNYGGRHYGYISAATKTKINATDSYEAVLFRELADDLSFALFNIDVIEQQEKNREQLIHAKESAEAANHAKDDFLAMMSHELRTPLNPIVGYSSLIKDEIESEEIRNYLDIILKSTERELELIDDILGYTRLNRNSFEPKWSEFSLFEVCESALNDVRAISHGLKLSFTPDNKDELLNSNLRVKGEKNMLLKILDNFLGNACKYTPEGSVELKLSRISSSDQESEFTFEVWDTGIGLDQNKIETIFEPFTQVDSSYTREFEGVGLGLSICKKLIDLLGGTKEVESTLGKGSCFRFTLPLEISEKVPQEKAPHTTKAVRPVFEWKKSVLLVEDNEDNIAVTCQILKNFRIMHSVSRNGLEAVQMSRLKKYDAIIMDLSMPLMNGIKASEVIRKQSGPNQNTSIIALTADASEEAREKCMAAGMNEYMAKPIQSQQLAEILEKVWQ